MSDYLVSHCIKGSTRVLLFVTVCNTNMAAALQAERELTATKLAETARQLRRYLESGSKSRRVLEKRIEKIESEKDELLELHHRYVEKSSTEITSEENVQYLQPKMDVAEDVLSTMQWIL